MRHPVVVFFLIVVTTVTAASVTQAAEQPPLKHPTLVNPATLSGTRAESVYQAIREQMRANYASWGDPVVLAYQGWKRFNKTPYRKKHHGQNYLNHYGNDSAADYAKYENLDPLPPGAIIIKDSFAVSDNGMVKTGPFFMMEKMGSGFVSGAGAWRFLMLRPNGLLVGMTGGIGAKNVQFCADCHKKAGAKRDYLYFLPRELRVPN